MDPITTSVIGLALGKVAKELLTDACKDHVKDKLKSILVKLEDPREQAKVEEAFCRILKQAYRGCLEMLLKNIQAAGYSDEELKDYAASLKAFIEDSEVAKELLKSVRDPRRDDLPSPGVLRERWKVLDGRELPLEKTIWETVAKAFHRQVVRETFITPDLREVLNAENILELRRLVERQGGVKLEISLQKYFERMRSKYSPVDLANLMPAYVKDPGQLVLSDVFVPQSVREDPPPVEIPKDLLDRLKENGASTLTGEIDPRQLERLQEAYLAKEPEPVLEVIANPENRLLVLTGEAGSGKSTLLRYLLTGIIDPPLDRETNSPVSWTNSFKNSFPLLIELKDFFAFRKTGKCPNFLGYISAINNTESWFVDDRSADDYLRERRSLIMFDGLDEIFDEAERERVINEIAGLAIRYSKARILVTTRPLGYKPYLLRSAGFAHFGIQDLDEPQIDAFVTGWFALTFPQDPQQSDQRALRVKDSIHRSKHIRLLAGNPMLLTIMALLAREQELPKERVNFYHEAVKVLCHHWDANRHLQLPEDSFLDAEDKEALLRRVAMHMQAGNGLKGNIITRMDLEQVIQDFLLAEHFVSGPSQSKHAARKMARQLRERNHILCLRGPNLYGFVHRTFLEYLTAAEYVRQFHWQPQQTTLDDLIRVFHDHCRQVEWFEVLRLICGQIDEEVVGRIIEHLAARTDEKMYRYDIHRLELPLAILCMNEARCLQKLSHSGLILFNVVIKYMQEDRRSSLRDIFFLRRSKKTLTDVTEELLKTMPIGSAYQNNIVLNGILDATKEIGVAWPGKPDLHLVAFLCDSMAYDCKLGWIQFLDALGASKEIFVKLLDHEIVSSGAGKILAKRWPDATRDLLEERAQNSPERLSLLQTLVETWCDDRTRELLEKVSFVDKDGFVRGEANNLLAIKWGLRHPGAPSHSLRPTSS